MGTLFRKVGIESSCREFRSTLLLNPSNFTLSELDKGGNTQGFCQGYKAGIRD